MDSVEPAVHRTILCVDIQGFGEPYRTNRDRIKIRAAMYRSLQEAFTRSRVHWDNCYCEDRGDGALILIPADVPKELVVRQLPHEVAAELQRHNRTADQRTRIRLRAAVHAGEIHHDTHGVAGSAINLAFRLLEADPLKAALRNSDAPLALIASTWFYHEVVRQLSPEHGSHVYRPVHVSVKETETKGWIYTASDHARTPHHPISLSIPGLNNRVPRQLPADVRNFVGRRHELHRLTSLLKKRINSGGKAASLIIGAAGVGKTALAVHWAHQVREDFPDGQLYVNLHGYDAERPTDPQRALEVMLLALGISAEQLPSDPEARSALYRSLLDGRRLLLLLDNAADAEQVRPLLPGTPSCAVVATSRNDLRGLVARDGAHPISLRRLAEADAISLLRQTIGSPRVDAERAATADLARHCDFLPLALRIAAERAAIRPHLSVADFVQELVQHNRLDVLTAAGRYTALRTVFSWSYQALPPEVARMFRLLALHPGPEISLPAATALTDASPAETRRLLDSLVGTHLLEETTKDRYRLHELLRCYAAELKETRDSHQVRSRAVRRILVWYLQAADSARHLLCAQCVPAPLGLPDVTCRPLTFTTRAQARQWCESEHLNLFAAAHHAAATGQDDIAWRLTLALQSFFFLRSTCADWIAIHQIGLGAAERAGDTSAMGYALGVLGYAYQYHRDFKVSITCLQQALNIFQRIKDQHGEAWCLHGIGNAHRGLHQFSQAVEHHQQALDITRQIGDRRSKAWALIGLAYDYVSLHLFREAFDQFQQALVLAQETERRAEGWILHGLGYACHGLRCFTDALEYYQRAYVVFCEVGDSRGQSESLYNLGRAQRDTGRPHATRLSWEMALNILEDLQAPQALRIQARLESLNATDAASAPREAGVTPQP